MSIPPDSIEAGKCYLMESGFIRRVTSTGSDGLVRYKERVDPGPWQPHWIKKCRSRDFAAQALREVACDWTPAAGEAQL